MCQTFFPVLDGTFGVFIVFQGRGYRTPTPDRVSSGWNPPAVSPWPCELVCVRSLQ